MAKKENPYQGLQQELNRQIREEDFKNIYLVCGNQDYLRTQNRDKLRTALLGTGDQMNSSYFSGDGFTLSELMDLANTLPFFAARRVITIENSWLFQKSGDEIDLFCDYLKELPDSTFLVFSEERPNKTQKMYKNIAKLGFVMVCDTPEPDDIRRWVVQMLRQEGFQIDGRALQVFLDHAGEDMLNIRNEADKLMGYCYGHKEITVQDVCDISSVVVQDRIFDMISAIASADRHLALSIYMDLLKLQTPPQVILSLMIRQFNQLLQAGEMLRNSSEKEVAQTLHINPWVLSNKVKPCLRGYTGRGLVKALQDCVQADMDYKSGKIDARLAVEKLIVIYSGGKA